MQKENKVNILKKLQINAVMVKCFKYCLELYFYYNLQLTIYL